MTILNISAAFHLDSFAIFSCSSLLGHSSSGDLLSFQTRLWLGTCSGSTIPVISRSTGKFLLATLMRLLQLKVLSVFGCVEVLRLLGKLLRIVNALKRSSTSTDRGIRNPLHALEKHSWHLKALDRPFPPRHEPQSCPWYPYTQSQNSQSTRQRLGLTSRH